VHVVEDELLEFPLSEGAVLYAVPCRSKAGQGDPTQQIPKRLEGDERIRIGMVHGSTFDAGDWQTNFPISREAAVERGLDYLAIGDTHGFRLVPPERLTPPTVYPGTPEPTAFDESEPGHVALVLINRQRRARVEKRRVANWTWETARVVDLSALRALASRTDLANRVLRLTVDMQVSAPEYEEAEALLAELGGTEARHAKAGVLELAREGLTLDVSNVGAQLEALPAVLQATVRRLQELAQDVSQRPAAERALIHLLQAAKGAA
jgi:DNA repair exonuclease SbcCD nuclease subunit